MPFQEHFLFWAYTQFSSWQLVNVRYKRANYINIFGISINFLFFSTENFRTKVELNRIVLRRWIFKSVYLHLHQFFGLCFEIETRAFSLRHFFLNRKVNICVSDRKWLIAVDVDRLQSRITSLSDCVACVVVSRISSLGFENLNAFEFSLKMNANESVEFTRVQVIPEMFWFFLELYVWYKKCVVARLKVLLKLFSNTKYDLAIKKCNNIEILFSSAPLKKMNVEKKYCENLWIHELRCERVIKKLKKM